MHGVKTFRLRVIQQDPSINLKLENLPSSRVLISPDYENRNEACRAAVRCKFQPARTQLTGGVPIVIADVQLTLPTN